MLWAAIGFVLALVLVVVVAESSLGLVLLSSFWGGLMVLAFKHKHCDTLAVRAAVMAGTAAVTLAGWGLVAALV